MTDPGERPSAVGSFPDHAVVRFSGGPGEKPIVDRMPVRLFLGDHQVAGPNDNKEKQLVRPATTREMDALRLVTDRFCGNCRHWNYERGQARAADDRFWERICREQGWKGQDQWTGPREEYGDCDEHHNRMAFKWSPADPRPGVPDSGCEEWRPSIGRVIRSCVRAAWAKGTG